MNHTCDVTSLRPDDRLYVEWDVANWARALNFWESYGRSIAQTRALEVGSRGGGLSLWLAERGAASVTCSDLAGPEPAAAVLHAIRGVPKEVVSYRAIDATAISERDAYDLIVFKSVLGGIGGASGPVGQRQALRSMYEALAPGGQLWFAENTVASPAHQVARRRFVRWADRWQYVAPSEMLDMLRPFAHVDWESIGFSAAFGRSEVQRERLGRLDQRFLERLVPSAWRYIMIGVATKGTGPLPPTG